MTRTSRDLWDFIHVTEDAEKEAEGQTWEVAEEMMAEFDKEHKPTNSSWVNPKQNKPKKSSSITKLLKTKKSDSNLSQGKNYLHISDQTLRRARTKCWKNIMGWKKSRILSSAKITFKNKSKILWGTLRECIASRPNLEERLKDILWIKCK